MGFLHPLANLELVLEGNVWVAVSSPVHTEPWGRQDIFMILFIIIYIYDIFIVYGSDF